MIIINQHNYEEFFLLYVDGELSAADKQAVEQFVQANPDLAIELEMLQQTLLINDELAFEDKDLLFRTEATEINSYNYEEHFLLYADNELTVGAKENVEKFVLQHPALQENFMLLQHTKLEPETIVFSDKQSLYRKEETKKPVFILGWQRIAIAAALIGFVVLVWTLIPHTISSEQNLAQQKSDEKSSGINSIGSEKKIKDRVLSNNVASNAVVTASVSNNGSKSISTEKNKLAKNKVVVETNNLIASNTTPAVSQPVESTRANTVSVTASTNETATAKVVQTLPVENTSISGIDLGKTPNNPEENKSYFTDNAQQAVYKELDTEDDKKSLLLGSLEINKDKLRGFFRKAGSIFRGKAKDMDEKTETRPSSNSRSLK